MLFHNILKLLTNVPFSILVSRDSILALAKKIKPAQQAQFVTVVYDDFHGIKRPIGLIHLVKLRGQMREVFTFCCNGKRQPNMALFVRNRTGNLAEQVALSFDDQDIIPAHLKSLPDAYKNEHFKTFSMAC